MICPEWPSVSYLQGDDGRIYCRSMHNGTPYTSHISPEMAETDADMTVLRNNLRNAIQVMIHEDKKGKAS